MSTQPAPRIEDGPTPSRSLTRRRILATAAWCVPAVTVAAAAPAFAASEAAAATVTMGASDGQVLSLGLLDDAGTGGSVASVNLLPAGPQGFTIQNTGTGELTNLTAQVDITYGGGLPLPLAKGFGVYSAYGDPALVSNRSETRVGTVVAGTYNTTQTLTLNDVAAGGTAWVPVVFGLTDGGSLGISAFMTFDITLRVFSGGTEVDSSTGTITLPVGITLL